ncbi:MAG: ferritin-like domain-containing protein [Armatimonadetes bacterium]|jgi:hypothetical protein|nr:ferritin-like domain-containing protein [Armatimonadota bacterium]
MRAYRSSSDPAARRLSGQARPRTYYTVEQSATICQNYFALEFELFTTLAGAVPVVADLEAKLALSHHLHSGMLRARELRARLVDFLIPEPEQKVPERWANFVRHLMTAPDDVTLLAALWRVIRPAQLHSYERHLSTTLPVNDAPTAELLERSLPGLRAEIDWGRDYLRRKEVPDTAGAFLAAIDEHLRALGGPMGVLVPPDAATPACYPPWRPPERMALESRFTLQSADRYTLPDWPEYEAIPTAYTHFTELPVVDIIGVTVFDGRALQMPFEYFADFTRQLWDEARHTQMGMERLQAFGIDPYAVPIPVGHYTVWANMPVLDRLASLTQVGEACSFVPKRQWVAAAWKRRDALSALEHEYDIVDERMHVRFGARWIPEIAARVRDERPVKQIVQDADWAFRERINRLRQQAGENWLEDLGERFKGCGTNTSPVSLAPALDGIPNIIA